MVILVPTLISGKMSDFIFNLPVKIIFGKGKINQLYTELPARLNNVLVVTDKAIFEKTSIISKIEKTISKKNICYFTDIEENPSIQTINRGADFAIKNNVDLVVGIGGGSSMDAAKGIAILATNRGSIKEYLEEKKFESDALPLICIPTTSGTGSEVTPYAVFTDAENEKKAAIAHDSIFPKVSIIDPELTYSMPPSVVLNTGLDALTHAIEAYLSTETFDLNDQIALRSIKLVIENIENAVKKDKDAMDAMAYASMLGGIAITHASTILPHIMGYPLTVYHQVPHGLANALVMPAFLEYMSNHSRVKEKVEKLSALFETKGGIKAFINGFGISTSLSDYGILKDELDKFCSKVIVKSDVKITPAPVTTEIIRGIYLKSF